MLTIKYNEIDLTVHQQSPQVSTKPHGYNGRLVIEPEYNRAYFTETMREPAAAKNPIIVRGRHIKFRINSDGRVRGTFMLDPDTHIDNVCILAEKIDDLIDNLSMTRRISNDVIVARTNRVHIFN